MLWLLKISLSEFPFTLFSPSNNAPIRAEFIRTAFIWKGDKWNIKVVGTINTSSRYAPNFCLNPEIKSIEPKTRQKIAEINKNGAKVEGIFLFVIIYCCIY